MNKKQKEFMEAMGVKKWDILGDFLRESNKIEGITNEITTEEIKAFDDFLNVDAICVADLEKFVSVFEPTAKLREKPGMDVMIGNHEPIAGGMGVACELILILSDSILDDVGPYECHKRYETLHPFMDCNGRSGRALWAWMMYERDGIQGLRLGFLHMWYYQSLSESRNYDLIFNSPIKKLAF